MATSDLDLDGFQRLLWGFASHRIITVAGRTGLLRLLAERAVTPETAASDLDLDPLATGKVLRTLAALGIAEADGDLYRASRSLALHFAAGDHDVVPFLEHSHSMYDRWGETLEPWLRGQDWPVAERTPEETARFGAAMRAMGAQMARRVAGALNLDGVARMLDVGGGWGHFARALCATNPELTAVVLDTPAVVERAAMELVGSGLEDRIEFVSGDYLGTDYGTGFDLVLLANILHQETAKRAGELVQRAADALAPRGRVVVVDFAIDDEQRQHLLGALFAINMRSFGDTWTEPHIRGWMASAGLGSFERIDHGPDRWILTGAR
ncbi:MAG: methyltransferase [Acidobacteriota bacterium]|nr:methyltransferase [Acidobacteriota bacterium]